MSLLSWPIPKLKESWKVLPNTGSKPTAPFGCLRRAQAEWSSRRSPLSSLAGILLFSRRGGLSCDSLYPPRFLKNSAHDRLPVDILFYCVVIRMSDLFGTNRSGQNDFEILIDEPMAASLNAIASADTKDIEATAVLSAAGVIEALQAQLEQYGFDLPGEADVRAEVTVLTLASSPDSAPFPLRVVTLSYGAGEDHVAIVVDTADGNVYVKSDVMDFSRIELSEAHLRAIASVD